MKLSNFQIKNKKQNPSLLAYREVMREISSLILNRLTYNKNIYQTKLDNLKVYFEPGDTTEGCLEIDFSKNLTRIHMSICLDDSLNYVRFIMAHELYHLLFSANSPVASMGYHYKDKSYQVNSIIRRNSDGEYGCQLNEQVCNVLAYETVACNFDSLTDRCNRWDEVTEYYYSFLNPIKYLIASFSTTIEKVEKDYNLEAGHESNNNFVPNNLFLYGIVNGNSELFVGLYDKYMGEHAYQRLCKFIDIFYVGNESKGIKPFDKKLFISIKSELDRFRMLTNLKGA